MTCYIHGQKLNTVKEAKYLGVTIDSKLTFNTHIDNICKKANSSKAFVHRNTKQCPRRVKAAAYKTLVRPKLEYCSAVCPLTLTIIKPGCKHYRRELQGQ